VTERQHDDLLEREPGMAAPNRAPAMPPDAIGRLADRTLGRCVAPAFGVLSRWRGTRSLHPDGQVHPVEVDVAPAAPMRPGRYRSAVRLSRGAGLPEPWPDALGLAVRLFDADGAGGVQDLLLTSSWSSTVVGRHLVFPARDYGAAFYSSVLPVRAGGRRVTVGARAVWAGPPRRLTRLADVDRAVGTGLRGFDLVFAHPIGGWRPLARIHLHPAVEAGDSEALRFNPYHQAAGLAPVGMLNAVRRRSYAASRRARPQGA
jgi:hypothetical protein